MKGQATLIRKLVLGAVCILLAAGLVLGGFGTRLMMGFSPTVWASEDRTFLIMHICMAMAAVLCLAAWPAKPKEKL